MLTDYSDHAAVWDWGGYDCTSEYEYWCNYAKRYGNKVLIPMCALGQIGAYMAQHGFFVTAFDYTPEMIEEGKKRFGEIKNLELVVGDICNISLAETSFDFAFTMDLELLDNIDRVKEAFVSLGKHLRKGGCLVLDMTLPGKESWDSPTKVFHPQKPVYTDKKVWKEGKGRYDSCTKRHYIDQIIFIEDEIGTRKLNHSICLQYYEPDELIQALHECGFAVINKSSGKDKESWKSGDSEYIVEAIKR